MAAAVAASSWNNRGRGHTCASNTQRLNETAVRARDDVVDSRPGGAGLPTYGWAGFRDRATPAAANGKRAHRLGHDAKIVNYYAYRNANSERNYGTGYFSLFYFLFASVHWIF